MPQRQQNVSKTAYGGSGGEEVKVAVIDSGIDADHPAVGGRISGTNAAQYDGPAMIDGNPCPCYAADWGNAGVYTENFSLKPESRAGIQAKFTVSKEINFVTQVVVRGTDSTPRVQWAYASYSPSKNLEFNVGRKRIPLYSGRTHCDQSRSALRSIAQRSAINSAGHYGLWRLGLQSHKLIGMP